MDVASFWEQVTSALRLDEPQAADTVSRTIQVLLVILITIGVAYWVGGWVRRAAMAGRIYAEVATLLSRAATLAIFAVGGTVVLALIGTSWTAIAAILGAATFGISLALQDVGRSFVNGVYILVERPFRIGDHVRVGAAEGRVEDVGVRSTILRTAAGDLVIVPNTVVFSSIIENSSAERIDRETYLVTGIERPVPEIQPAVIAALRGTPHLSHHAPVVELIRSSPDGTDVEVTIEHDLGIRVDDQVTERLRALLPGGDRRQKDIHRRIVTDSNQPRRIGVLGGTFDPVHYGHLYAANALRAALDLDRIVWVPAGRPPHKTGQIVSMDRDRLTMLDLALAGSRVDEISTIDIDRPGPSYTADTLEILAQRFSPARLFFLMGEDSLRDLPNWHNPERLLRVAELAVAARPGVEADLESVARHVPAVQGRLHLVPTDEIAISSSEIRRRVRESHSIHELVPPPVEAYIWDHGLYTQESQRAGPAAIR